MARKNLARTVVEGGRDTYSKLYRKLRNRSERRLRFDLEGDVMYGQERVGGSRGFADRLAPLERWLGSNVGREGGATSITSSANASTSAR